MAFTTASLLRTMTGRPTTLILGAALLLGSAGCSWLGLDDEPTTSAALAPTPAPVASPPPAAAPIPKDACPTIEFVKDLKDATLVKEGASSAHDITSHATLVDFTQSCAVQNTGVTVTLKLRISAERGPAHKGHDASFAYFVAVADPSGSILAKRDFTTTLAFTKAHPTSGSLETLAQTIPLPKGADPRSYKVMIGFELSQDQLRYNRTHAL